MAAKEAVERRLFAKALYRAADFGFASGCEGLVRDLISDAVQTLENEGYLSDPERLAMAEVNVERFIYEMIMEARRNGDYELHEGTFAFARSRLCPLWPLC